MISMAAVAEQSPAALCNGVYFGMTMDQVIAAEPSRFSEIDNNRTRGPVDYVGLEYEPVDVFGMRADVKYLFAGDTLAAIQMKFDTEDYGVSYEAIKDSIVKQYGESTPLDLAALGDAIYAVDDDGRLEGRAEAWMVDSMAVVLERDHDDVDVTFVDLSQNSLK